MGSELEVLGGEAVHLDWLAGAAASLGAAAHLSDVLAIVVRRAADCLGPVGGMLGMLDASGRTVIIADLLGTPPSYSRGNKSLPVAAGLPIADAVTSGRAVWVAGPEDRARRYPELAARTPEPHACGSLPLTEAGRVVGVLCLIRMLDEPGRAPFSAAEQAVAGALADLASAAVARLAEAGRRAPAPRAGRRDDLNAALAAVVTMADLGEAAAAALPSLGAEGLVIAEQDSGRVAVVARAGFTPAERARMNGAARARRPAADAALAARVPEYAASTGQFGARYPHLADLLAGVGDHAWAVVPLASGYDAPAVCLLAFPAGGVPGGGQQARLLTTCGLLAQALDRCRMHDQEHRLVTELHGGMPATLPGLELACHYQPATFGLGVGGDFYDAFTSPDGSAALVIGDVQGHGPAAAGLAGVVRTAIRAYAIDGHDPAGVIGRTSRFLASLNGERPDPLYATCCFLTIDPLTGHGLACRAGHPHPAVITEDGPALLLAGDGGLPLGVDPAYPYHAARFTVRPGLTILLYTDGLTERPGSDSQDGAESLARMLAGVSLADPAAVVAGLCRLGQSHARYDDIAVLVARYTGQP